MVLTLESSLDCKEIQPVHPTGNQSWVFIGRTDVEAEAAILWPPHAKSWLIGKDPDAGRDWGQEEKGTTEDEMAGWNRWLDGHEFEWTPGVGDGQGGLACCDLWGHRVRDDWATELNWTEGGANGKESAYQCRRCKRLGFPGCGRSPGVGMTTHFAWRIPWIEEPGRQGLDATEHARARTHTHTHTHTRSKVICNISKTGPLNISALSSMPLDPPGWQEGR